MIVLGTEAARPVADGLGAGLLVIDGDLAAWRESAAAGSDDRVVVAAWPSALAAGRAEELDLDGWAARGEQPLHAWVAALGAAVRRVADGGVIVSVVDRPSPLDCAGWAPESGIADAVEALTRSLARSEGPRGVRVHCVTTPRRTAPSDPVMPAPPLTSFPGTLDDVVSAVRLLLDAPGLTNQVVHADAGRSWR